jgi:hypothetical protein
MLAVLSQQHGVTAWTPGSVSYAVTLLLSDTCGHQAGWTYAVTTVGQYTRMHHAFTVCMFAASMIHAVATTECTGDVFQGVFDSQSLLWCVLAGAQPVP